VAGFDFLTGTLTVQLDEGIYSAELGEFDPNALLSALFGSRAA
jgi:hypothetical protein